MGETNVDIPAWIDRTLWSRWGWQGWTEDDFRSPCRDEAEKARITSAVTFVLRCLGNNERPDTQAVVDSIVARRTVKAEGRKV